MNIKDRASAKSYQSKSSRPTKAARVYDNFPEDINEDDEDLELVGRQIVEKHGFENGSFIE